MGIYLLENRGSGLNFHQSLFMQSNSFMQRKNFEWGDVPDVCLDSDIPK